MSRHAMTLLLATQLGCGGVAAQTTEAPSPDDATTTLSEDLSYLREEEKLARDVYVHLGERWGTQAFRNISGAEQRHMDRVGTLLPSRGIQDPIADDSVGSFTNATLAGLFRELTQTGEASETAALRVGATVEDLDIRDIEDMLARTDDPAVTQTYQLLLCGSRNHMRAFSGLLQSRGETYTPQYISHESYAEILAGEHVRCGRVYGGGQGMGGQGMGGQGMGGQGMRGQGMGGQGMGGQGMGGQGMGQAMEVSDDE